MTEPPIGCLLVLPWTDLRPRATSMRAQRLRQSRKLRRQRERTSES